MEEKNNMKICPVCKKTITDESIFCTSCGIKLNMVADREYNAPPIQQNQVNVAQANNKKHAPVKQHEEAESGEITEKTEAQNEKKANKNTEKKGNSVWIMLLVTICVLAICFTVCFVVLHKTNPEKESAESVSMVQQVGKNTEVTTKETTQVTEVLTETMTTETVNSATSTDYIVDSNMLSNRVGLVGYKDILFFGDLTTDIPADEVAWENLNPEIVKINQDTWDIEFVKEGKATILATYKGKTYGCTVIVAGRDANKYPVAIESSVSSLELELGGEINGDNRLNIEYTVSGEYPSTAEVTAVTTEFLSDPLIIGGWTVLHEGTFALDVYPYEGIGETELTTILWDSETEKIYGINIIPVSIK